MKFSPGLLEVSRSWECEKQTENIKTPAVREISSSLSWHSSSWSHVLCWMIRVFTHKTIKISKLWLFFALRCEWIIFQTCFKTSFLDLGTHDECFQVRSRPTCCKGGRLFCCVIVRGECELLTVGTRGQASAARLFHMKTPTLLCFWVLTDQRAALLTDCGWPLFVCQRGGLELNCCQSERENTERFWFRNSL